MKKVFVIFLLMMSLMTKVSALELSSRDVVLYNLNENKVIYEENKDEKTSIASLTKIMTTLVALDHIDDIKKSVIMKKEMFEGLTEANAAVVGLKVGQKVTYEDLLYGMLIASGADATRGIAISLAGSEDKFVEWMNDKAKKLGLSGTHFANTTGLDNSEHYSTANDVAKLLIIALKNKEFKKIFTTYSYTISDRSIPIYSTLYKTATKNGLDVDYIEGAKTGFTIDAGRCLASIAYDKANDIRYLLVTTGASVDSDYYHILDATKVYTYYFNNYKYHNVIDKGDLLVILKTRYGTKKEIKFYADKEIKFYLDNSFDKKNISLKYNGTDIIKTNMKIGDKLGTIDILYDGKKITSADIVLKEKVYFSILVFLRENILAVATIIVILILLFFTTRKKKNKKKRRK
jgi:D-alanyl-D-alanine carboxypeptidase (penicillin-binding protein 5/6)